MSEIYEDFVRYFRAPPSGLPGFAADEQQELSLYLVANPQRRRDLLELPSAELPAAFARLRRQLVSRMLPGAKRRRSLRSHVRTVLAAPLPPSPGAWPDRIFHYRFEPARVALAVAWVLDPESKSMVHPEARGSLAVREIVDALWARYLAHEVGEKHVGFEAPSESGDSDPDWSDTAGNSDGEWFGAEVRRWLDAIKLLEPLRAALGPTLESFLAVSLQTDSMDEVATRIGISRATAYRLQAQAETVIENWHERVALGTTAGTLRVLLRALTELAEERSEFLLDSDASPINRLRGVRQNSSQ